MTNGQRLRLTRVIQLGAEIANLQRDRADVVKAIDLKISDTEAQLGALLTNRKTNKSRHVGERERERESTAHAVSKKAPARKRRKLRKKAAPALAVPPAPPALPAYEPMPGGQQSAVLGYLRSAGPTGATCLEISPFVFPDKSIEKAKAATSRILWDLSTIRHVVRKGTGDQAGRWFAVEGA